ncbi:MAG: GGDEF domain-containing protein [Clostridium sp.]|nr:GGDEF domain-containing protein [Clostridium sp.]
MNKRSRLYHIMYAFMAITICILIVSVAIKGGTPSPTDELSEGTVAFGGDWTLENGTAVDLNYLNKTEGVKTGKQFSIYSTLPDKLQEGLSLCFRTKNIFYKVYIDGKLRYEPEVEESNSYNQSLGNRHSYVPLSSEDAGKTVQIKITTVYDNAKTRITDVYIGTSGGVALSFIRQELFAILNSVLLLFIGIILIFADIPLNFKQEKNHELMYLGFTSVSIAVWCLLETGVFQLFLGDSRLIQTITCTVLMLIVIPMTLYFDKAFGFGFKHVKGLLCTFSFLGFLVCFSLHFLKIMDFHETLVITHVLCVFSAAVIILSVIKKRAKKEKTESKTIFSVFRAVGLLAISVSAMLDIVRFYVSASPDAAMCVRVGLIIFMICFGLSSLEKTINAVKLGARSEMISGLAYKDGLTGVGNRTLFKERVAELEENKNYANEVIFVMFDVNDLKYINDKMGHQIGDQLIVKGAEIIRNSFEGLGGSCYRIGGDEFIVIITGDVPVAQYNEGMKRFESAIAEHNANPDKKFRISIAYGYATYNESSRDKTMSDIWHMADAFMYRNKKDMKARMIEADAYYTGKLYASDK